MLTKCEWVIDGIQRRVSGSVVVVVVVVVAAAAAVVVVVLEGWGGVQCVLNRSCDDIPQ